LVEVATTTPVATAAPPQVVHAPAGTVTTDAPAPQVVHAPAAPAGTVTTDAAAEEAALLEATAVGMVRVTVLGVAHAVQTVVTVVHGTVGAGLSVQPQPVAVTVPV